ncbi:exopolysaccharide biosynthesis protein [Bradyrhizobium sp. KBS0727]|uniref:exopolysaccharide biosynthesis protein n=1 Tax=unclassified Bradyrhizobium TaxID=2631580 RepID=UPI00110E2CD3|nr:MULTISPECIES: exopolysaccharide biosynthesis protein [unclassified Bradyrhizobium]QDW41400.1 exopolysaccharide biosynthesis protein [Bradyrhizobium sp. KBS0725]QDW48006.1 exopolysaccharide biosynthesis protein [Bradyrhizobium sp. KBS0727]
MASMLQDHKTFKPVDAESLPIPVTATLSDLVNNLPGEHFTIEWLLGRLDRRSFGIVLLVMSLVAMVPGISLLIGPLLAIPAFEMILGRSGPSFPRRIAVYPLRSSALTGIVRRALPLLAMLEKIVHPRWPISPGISRRAAGIAILALSGLFLAPLPLIQIVPALLVALIALAYLEQDGLLLCVSLLGSVILLLVTTAAIWGAILGAMHIGG